MSLKGPKAIQNSIYLHGIKEHSINVDYLFTLYRKRFGHWISYVTNGSCNENDIVLRGNIYEFISVEQKIGAYLIKGRQGIAEIEKNLMSADVDYKIIFKISVGKTPESYENNIITVDVQYLFIPYDMNYMYKDSVMIFQTEQNAALIMLYPNDKPVQTMLPTSYVAVWNRLLPGSPSFILDLGTTNMAHMYKVR